MKDKVRIPIALQIVMDDFGWHEGKFELHLGGPARTNINRKHDVRDITTVNAVGEGLGMNILCGFTIGEWDKDNVLRGMKHATKYEDNWDRKSYIDMDYACRAYEEIEKSDHIDIAFHGLMHGYWDNGENYGNPREFFMYDLPEGATERRLDYPVIPTSAEYVRSHVEAFFKIYNGWNFTKEVKSFISPASLYKDESFALAYADVLRPFGIRFWKNGWREFEGNVCMLRDITFLQSSELVPYDAMNVKPLELEDIKYDENAYPESLSVVGMHWANFLWDDPAMQAQYVADWVTYFKRQAEIFGFMLSTDISFAASQALYQRYLKMSFEGNKCIIDASAMKALDAPELKNEFYVSIVNGSTPQKISGGTVEVYEKHNDFTVYKIVPQGDTVSFEI